MYASNMKTVLSPSDLASQVQIESLKHLSAGGIGIRA